MRTWLNTIGNLSPELKSWLLCDCILSILPVPLVLFGAWLKNQRIPFVAVIRDGQLYFYCCSLCAVALRDLAKSRVRPPDLLWWQPGLVLAIVVFSYAFAVVVQHSMSLERGAREVRQMDNRVAWTSVIFAIASTVLVGYIRVQVNVW
jgi:hypothetical protein